MKNTKVLQTDQGTIDKVKAARVRMKEIRRSTAKNEGPQTVEEAAEYLAKKVSMACPPSACVEYEGTFFFSGGTTTERDTNFLSGFAIRKGDNAIHSWQQERKDK